MALHAINFSPEFIRHLARRGVGGMPRGRFAVDDGTAFEPPVDLRGAYVFDGEVAIGAFTYLGPNAFVSSVRIGRYCSIAQGVQIGLPSHPTGWLTASPIGFMPFPGFEEPLRAADPAWRRALPVAVYDDHAMTTIGNDVWIGANAYLKPGITVGDGAIVGACAVVTHDVAPYAIVAGSPARVLRYRFPDAVIARLQAVAWWRCNLLDLPGLDVSDIAACLDELEARIAGGQVVGYAPDRVSPIAERARFDAADPGPPLARVA